MCDSVLFSKAGDRKKKKKKEVQEEDKDERRCWGLGQEQGGRFMASRHFFYLLVLFFFSQLNKHEKCETISCTTFFHHKIPQDLCFQLKWFHFHKGPTEEFWLRNGPGVKVVKVTLRTTKVILLGRVMMRHDRYAHRLKLSKYECSETGPVWIAVVPHVP